MSPKSKTQDVTPEAINKIAASAMKLRALGMRPELNDEVKSTLKNVVMAIHKAQNVDATTGAADLTMALRRVQTLKAATSEKHKAANSKDRVQLKRELEAFQEMLELGNAIQETVRPFVDNAELRKLTVEDGETPKEEKGEKKDVKPDDKSDAPEEKKETAADAAK